MNQEEKVDLAYYLAEIDGKTIDDWLKVTDNTKNLRAIDHLRMFYYIQFKTREGMTT